MFEKIDDTSKDGVVAEIPVLKTRKALGNTEKRHYCKLWEVNLSDLSDIKEAEYKETKIDLSTTSELGTNTIHHQAVIKPGYFYAMAINKKNALRKFWKVNPGFKI